MSPGFVDDQPIETFSTLGKIEGNENLSAANPPINEEKATINPITDTLIEICRLQSWKLLHRIHFFAPLVIDSLHMMHCISGFSIH